MSGYRSRPLRDPAEIYEREEGAPIKKRYGCSACEHRRQDGSCDKGMVWDRESRCDGWDLSPDWEKRIE